jgi:hypothetical protein
MRGVEEKDKMGIRWGSKGERSGHVMRRDKIRMKGAYFIAVDRMQLLQKHHMLNIQR